MSILFNLLTEVNFGATYSKTYQFQLAVCNLTKIVFGLLQKAAVQKSLLIFFYELFVDIENPCENRSSSDIILSTIKRNHTSKIMHFIRSYENFSGTSMWDNAQSNVFSKKLNT